MGQMTTSRWMVATLVLVWMSASCTWVGELDDPDEGADDGDRDAAVADGGDTAPEADAAKDTGDTDGEGDATANGDDDESEVTGRVEDLVGSDSYDRLVIEVDWVEGRMVRDGIAGRLADSIEEVVDKPAGVEVVFDDELDETAPSEGWSFDELQQLVDDHRDAAVDEGTIDAYTLLVDGEYGDSEGNVLGVAWGNRNAVLFMDRIEEACQGAGIVPGLAQDLCEHAELTVWRHELGHVLGLVNNGAPLQSDHEDDDNARHCSHDDCVMYWAYRRPDMVDRLADRLLGGEESAPDFDEACRADLEAIE